MARVFAVFGPENFIRSSKGPETEVRRFPVQYPNDSDFTLYVFYGGIKKDFEGVVPSALVTLNGRHVVTPDEFNRNVHYIKKPVTLLEGNSLSVELRGKPGSGIRVVITAQNDEPRSFDFRDIIQPDGIGLFGLDMSYLWTIVDEPEDGNARLSDPFSPSPFLTAELPGEYNLQLKIQGDSWEESFPVKLTALDVLTATYNDTPFVPVPVKTRVVAGTGAQYLDYSIQVGSTIYVAPAPQSCGSASNSGFQILVLNRSSLTKKDHETFNVPCGNSNMVNFLNTLGSDSLVIISSLNNAAPSSVCDNLSSCALGTKLIEFGATNIFPSNYSKTLSYSLSDGSTVNFSYSLIGIRGLGQNQGYELNDNDHRAVSLDSKIYSNIEGYFVPDANPNPTSMWTFVYPEFVEIETRAQSSAASNMIKVGGVSYVSPPLAEVDYYPFYVDGGFQVLVLDRDTLSPATSLSLKGMKTNMTFSTGEGGYSDYEQSKMSDYLTTILNTGYPNQRFVAVIASIGRPVYRQPSNIDSWNDVVQTTGNHYGATLGVVNQLGTSSTYSLIGFSSSDASPFGAHDAVEASSSGVNLRVVLQKDKQGWFKPAITNPGTVGATGGPDLSILPVALQPYTPWPLPNPALPTTDPLYVQQTEAYKYISRYLDLTDDIRSNYAKDPIFPGTWLSGCNTLQYPVTTAFTEDDFVAMKKQLCGYHNEQGQLVPGEFHFVQSVNGFKTVMDDNVWVNMKLSSADRLRNVYAAVKPLVNPPPDRTVLYNMGIVMRGMLTAGTSIVTNAGLKATMGIINGLMSIAMGLSKGEDGTDYTSLDTKVSELDNQMDDLWARCQKGSDIALGIIKSDWGKLQYVGNKFMIPQDQGGWMWDDGDQYDWVDQITNTLEAYYFQSLIPTLWKIDYMQGTTIPHPKNFSYYAGSSWSPNCHPYCMGASANDSAFWVDNFSVGASYNYSWYVLEDEIDMYASSGCGYVHLDRSSGLRDVLLGQGAWLEGGIEVGVKLNLSRPVLYERWLPSTIYTPYVAPIWPYNPTPYNVECSS